jgi:hypothetical protein
MLSPHWPTSNSSSTTNFMWLSATELTDSYRELTCSWAELHLRPTVCRPVCLGIKHACWTYDQIFITVRQFRVFIFVALSLTRGRVCCLQLLLALASAVILGSESRGTRDHILFSQIRDFPFRCFLRLASLRRRYSTPPPRWLNRSADCLQDNSSARTPRKSLSSSVTDVFLQLRCLAIDVLLLRAFA